MEHRKTNLLRSLLSVSGLTFFSRILGFVRDMIVARYFGASAATDAFNVALKLPNLLRRIFAEGAFSQAFVPVLAEYKNTRSVSETHAFIASVTGILSLVLLAVTILRMIFASGVILITAPGFTTDPAKFALTVDMLRITFPYILLISIASLMGGVLNTWGWFSIPSFVPTLLNISYIVFILLFRHYFHPPIMTMAWATFVGGVFQLAFQIPFLKKVGMLVRPRLDWHNPAVMRVLKLMGPAIFAVSIAQISLVINTIYASFLPTGSISWMYYADRLMEFPSALLGVSLGTILLPSLSKHASAKNHEGFSQLLDWGLRLCLLLALPAAIGLGILAKPLAMTLFMRGKFTEFDATMTSYALMAYSVGLLGIIMVKVLAPGFYANQDIKTPVKIAIFVLICTQLMNLVFIGPLKHAGLSLSIGLSACINASCLCYFLIKKNLYHPEAGWRSFLLRLFIAIVIMGGVMVAALYFLPLTFSGHLLWRVISLAVVIIIGVVGYFGGLFMMGFRVRDFSYRDHI